MDEYMIQPPSLSECLGIQRYPDHEKVLVSSGKVNSNSVYGNNYGEGYDDNTIKCPG